MNMADWSSLLAQCFGWILRASWQGAILVVAVLIIQWLLRRRLSAGWRFSLWLLVVVRLLLPISAESSLSVFNFVAQQPVVVSTTREVKPAEPAPKPAPAKTPQTPAVRAEGNKSNTASSATPRKSIAATTDPIPSTREAIVVPLPPVAPKPWAISGWEIAAWVWLAGAIALAAHVAMIMLGMARKVRRAAKIEDEAILQLFEGCRAQMNVRSRVSLLETDIVTSPALFGMIRPCLLLPVGMMHRFSQDELRYVFLHELAHVKRRDVSLNWLLTALQIVHWFNPVIWFCFARMRADRELACDALAISSAGETEAKAYGQTIIKLLETLSQSATQPGLVGIMEDKNQIKQRISMIARFKQRPRLSILALGFMVALAATGLTDAVKSTKAKAPSPAKEEVGETISVTIVDAESGKPVSGARVIVPFSNNIRYNEPPPTKSADETGRVTMSRSDASQFGFGILHPQYAPVAITWNWSSREPLKERPKAPNEYTVQLDRGTEVGGTVVDENGKPVPNVRVEIKGSTYPRRDTADVSGLVYSFYETLFGECPVTDENGRWTVAHFPREIEMLQITCVRPDNSCVQFRTETPAWIAGRGGELIKKEDIFAKTAVFALTPGITVRGVVVDADGNPLAGISLKENDARLHSKPLAEMVTGKDGRFELPNRDPHQILIKATGTGYAMNSAVVNIEPKMGEVRIQMSPAVPLRVRIENESGQPLAKAMMVPSLKIGWTGTADAEGRIIWSDAPAEPMTYQIHADKHGSVSKTLTPGQEEQIIRIGKGETPSIRVSIRATDEKQEPLKSFTVSVVRGHRLSKNARALGEGANGTFNGTTPIENEDFAAYLLKIEAPGFEPFVTENLDRTADVDLSVRVRKSAGPVRGLVLLPNGNPAPGAKLLLPDPTNSEPTISLREAGANRAPVCDDTDIKTVRADDHGHYSLPETAGNPAVVLVVHAEGFAETTLSDLTNSSDIRLQPWARLEGIYQLNSQPRENIRLMLQPKKRKGYRLWIHSLADSDKNGRFQIGNLPPGEYTLYASKVSSGTWPQNHPFPVKLSAGETLKVTYNCTGRAITGRLRLAAPDVDIDWKNDLEPRMLTARGKKGTDEFPIFDNYIRYEDYRNAIVRRNTEGISNSPSTYSAEIDSDGSFRIEGVTEGDYELEFGIVKRTADRNDRGEPMATLKREINVPPGYLDEPLDVGVLEMPIDPNRVPKKPAAALLAKTLTGQAFDLAHLRGKLVLLTFWATWAKPSAEELAHWKEVSDAFGTDPRVVLVAVALGEKPDAATLPPEMAKLNWVHTQLDGRDLAAATEAWGVDSLPVSFLVSPEGWIAGRDINPAYMREQIKQSLEATKQSK